MKRDDDAPTATWLRDAEADDQADFGRALLRSERRRRRLERFIGRRTLLVHRALLAVAALTLILRVDEMLRPLRTLPWALALAALMWFPNQAADASRYFRWHTWARWPDNPWLLLVFGWPVLLLTIVIWT